ncbi:MAG: dTMP kinase [Planctomycetales bacterium]|nr:dTMP kinase [Planctomycetales bacterium]NIM07905.1 dTMP kinase [Planctomycetales bacterium]NIN07392.1 dTMP kinase [Planctomycetales bacterium]NIN76496.1 dTMP kinase [Planctomycetales bacterium]NIO33686.1 dTMP kinase [Planctomycetales bacterium]
MFFSFDGIDGAGKSTQIALLVQHLKDAGHKVVTCRDPGSTELGESIRGLLLGDHQTPISPISELLLYMAARAQLVCEVIQPALEAGQVVVSDRFLLSNVVYQGHAGGVGVEAAWQIGQVATGGISPDLTFVLDLSPGAAAGRMDRKLDRMEQRGDEYRRKLRQGFLEEADRHPERIVVIDADGTVEQVQAAVRAAAARFLPVGGQSSD